MRRHKKTLRIVPSRLTLAMLLFVPMLFYVIGILTLPLKYPAFVSDVEIGSQIKPIINFLTPLLMATLVFYFRDRRPRDKPQRLTPVQFWISVACLVTYHVIVGCAFWITVWTADYSNVQTYQESLNGRINNFAAVMNSCSLLAIFPIVSIFSKSADGSNATPAVLTGRGF